MQAQQLSGSQLSAEVDSGFGPGTRMQRLRIEQQPIQIKQTGLGRCAGLVQIGHLCLQQPIEMLLALKGLVTLVGWPKFSSNHC